MPDADSNVQLESGTLKLTAGVSGAATLTKGGSSASNDLEVKNLRINGLTVSNGRVILTPNSIAEPVSHPAQHVRNVPIWGARMVDDTMVW